jgi:hypothetical protein
MQIKKFKAIKELVDISKEPIPVIKSLSETWKTERQEGNQ